MFCREVAILSKLNSPYVINFLGACLDDPSVSNKSVNRAILSSADNLCKQFGPRSGPTESQLDLDPSRLTL